MEELCPLAQEYDTISLMENYGDRPIDVQHGDDAEKYCLSCLPSHFKAIHTQKHFAQLMNFDHDIKKWSGTQHKQYASWSIEHGDIVATVNGQLESFEVLSFEMNSTAPERFLHFRATVQKHSRYQGKYFVFLIHDEIMGYICECVMTYDEYHLFTKDLKPESRDGRKPMYYIDIQPFLLHEAPGIYSISKMK